MLNVCCLAKDIVLFALNKTEEMLKLCYPKTNVSQKKFIILIAISYRDYLRPFKKNICQFCVWSGTTIKTLLLI